MLFIFVILMENVKVCKSIYHYFWKKTQGAFIRAGKFIRTRIFIQYVNPIALRMAKTLYVRGLNEKV